MFSLTSCFSGMSPFNVTSRYVSIISYFSVHEDRGCTLIEPLKFVEDSPDECEPSCRWTDLNTQGIGSLTLSESEIFPLIFIAAQCKY